MSAELPIGKIGRALSSGHTAVKIGGKMLSYYTKRPFLSSDDRRLNEVAERLSEEVDYLKEAEHVDYFTAHLKVDGVRTPMVRTHLSALTVLCTSLLPGRPLDVRLQDNPGQEARDRIAQILNDSK